jgi:hypothetical protein
VEDSVVIGDIGVATGVSEGDSVTAGVDFFSPIQSNNNIVIKVKIQFFHYLCKIFLIPVYSLDTVLIIQKKYHSKVLNKSII